MKIQEAHPRFGNWVKHALWWIQVTSKPEASRKSPTIYNLTSDTEPCPIFALRNRGASHHSLLQAALMACFKAGFWGAQQLVAKEATPENWMKWMKWYGRNWRNVWKYRCWTCGRSSTSSRTLHNLAEPLQFPLDHFKGYFTSSSILEWPKYAEARGCRHFPHCIFLFVFVCQPIIITEGRRN